MDERPPWERPDDANDSDRASERDKDKTEGVRIIGAEEAAKAQERGDFASRRAEGMPRYGDRPESPPEDARPALRFPLGGAGDPSDVPRPRVTGSSPDQASRPSAPLPPWTDPPTGEVPRILPEGDDGADDLEAWSGIAAGGPRWRDHTTDWDEPDYDDASMLHDEETRVGALDESYRPAPDDFFGFDEEPEAEPPPAVVRTGLRAAPPRAGSRVDAGGLPNAGLPGAPLAGSDNPDRDLRTAVVIGVGFAVAALVLFSMGTGPAMVLVAGVIVVAAAELFAALQRGGYQPATLLGLVATASIVPAAYWKGEAAIPLVLGLTVVFTLLWYLVGVTRVAPTMNVAVTIFAVAYVGLLGAFAALILTFPNGIGVLIGVVLAVVANDVGALVVGRRMGRARLAPEISPNKTVEGLVGGTLGSVVVAVVVLGVIGIHPWDTGSALALGLVVAVAAPLGDLCESMVKRDLGVKDMGSVLPGHGGLLDRFDAMLFCLPAAYYLCRLLEVF